MRTRAHVIEDLSENYLEKQVLLAGHILRRPDRDYGVDVAMSHFDSRGRVENGEVRFQLKATDGLKTVRDGSISVRVETRDLVHWSWEVFPFILVIYDARAERAYWLDVKQYVRGNSRSIRSNAKKITVRIPSSNELTVATVHRFRRESLTVVDALLPKDEAEDATRQKPR
jgi:hypothetical protein